jgi:hypothetical protein
MSALPCPLADPFAAADQTYATISQFLGSEEACQVTHSDLERQLEEMGRELMRKLLQAHLDLRQPGKAIEPVGVRDIHVGTCAVSFFGATILAY